VGGNRPLTLASALGEGAFTSVYRRSPHSAEFAQTFRSFRDTRSVWNCCPDFVHVCLHACASLLSSGDEGFSAHCGATAGSSNYMSYSSGLGGRYVDLCILRALGSVGPEPVTARELALTVATSTGSVAPTLRSLVKGGLVQRYWGELRPVRTYAITMQGREYLALRPAAASVTL
jgi:hypothetical protein